MFWPIEEQTDYMLKVGHSVTADELEPGEQFLTKREITTGGWQWYSDWSKTWNKFESSYGSSRLFLHKEMQKGLAAAAAQIKGKQKTAPISLALGEAMRSLSDYMCSGTACNVLLPGYMIRKTKGKSGVPVYKLAKKPAKAKRTKVMRGDYQRVCQIASRAIEDKYGVCFQGFNSSYCTDYAKKFVFIKKLLTWKDIVEHVNGEANSNSYRADAAKKDLGRMELLKKAWDAPNDCPEKKD